jgi:hypothetical protein
MKEEDEKDVKVGKNWVDGEMLHLISLWGKMNLNLFKMERNKINYIAYLKS